MSTITFSANSNVVREVDFQQAHRDRVRAEMTPRTLASKLSEVNDVALNVLFAARNGAAGGAILAGTAAAMAPAIGGLSIAGGVGGFICGANMIKNSLEKLPTDYQNGNLEGAFDHGAFGLLGVGFSTFSSAMIASSIAAFAGAAATAAAAGTATIIIGLPTYACLGSWATYGLAVNSAFKSQLNEKEGEGLHSAMSWLSDQVRGEWTDEFMLQKKWDIFAFRTSEAACRLVREELTPEFLDLLKKKDKTTVNRAGFIIQEVKRANAKQILKFSLFIGIVLIGVVALACGLAFANPVVACLLFAFVSILWLGMVWGDVHEKIGDLVCGKSQILPPRLEEYEKPSVFDF